MCTYEIYHIRQILLFHAVRLVVQLVVSTLSRVEVLELSEIFFEAARECGTLTG
jgi:GTP-sensing pleiotropic transcriptional regulator CodY